MGDTNHIIEIPEGQDLPSLLTGTQMKELLPSYLADLHNAGKAPDTIANYRQRVTAFLAWRSDRDLTLRLMVDYVIYLQTEHPGEEGKGCRPRTIRGHFHALGSFWKFARLQGYQDLPPLRAVPLPRLDSADNVTPSDNQVDALVTAAPRVGRNVRNADYRSYLSQRAVMVITLGLWLGLRRAEMLALDVGDLYRNEKGWQLRIRRSKGGEGRIIPVPQPAYEKFAAWKAVRDARCLAKGLELPACLIDPTCRRMGCHGIAAVLEEVKLLAGLENSGITLHSLRHGCATLLIRCGVDLPTIQKILGHANLETTMKYLHSDRETMASGMDRLGERLAGSPAVAPREPVSTRRERPVRRRSRRVPAR